MDHESTRLRNTVYLSQLHCQKMCLQDSEWSGPAHMQEDHPAAISLKSLNEEGR